mmetsp:Transcript_28517/g.37305  ORF Transcript_28517/g.37305 Transcript_28517/m.37305 type:complete len:491 (+) Transcript_28517:172-1644(+)
MGEVSEEVTKKEDRRRIFVIKIVYFCLFGATSCVYTLLPVFLEYIGRNKEEIGILSSLLPLITCWASPLWSAVADRFKLHKLLLFTAIILSALVRYFYLGTPSFTDLFIWIAIASFLDAPQAPFLDAFSMKQLIDVTTWGKIRLWGAIGFGLFSFVAGCIVTYTPFGWLGMFIVYWVLMGLTFVLLFPVFDSTSSNSDIKAEENKKIEEREIEEEAENNGLIELTAAEEWDKMLPEGVKEPKEQDSTDNRKQKEEAKPDNDFEISMQNKSNILKNLIAICTVRENLWFFFIIYVGGTSAGIIDTFLYVFLKDLGADEALMGTARAITCIAEIPFFHYANLLIHRLGEHGVLIVALIFYVIRLFYYSLLEHLPLWAVLPAETLHGFTYAALWAASTAYGFKIAPPHMKTTIQGLVSGIHWGIGFGSGSLIGGFVFDLFGPVALFRSTAWVVCSILCVFFLYKFICMRIGVRAAISSSRPSLHQHPLDDGLN